jgi:thiol-disulfide isomerase/thioredoxin
MASLKNIIVKFFTSNKFSMWMFLLIVLLILAVVYGYSYFYLPYKNSQMFKNISNNGEAESRVFEGSSNKVTIYCFTVDWCPYCQKAKPEWDNFSKNYENKQVKGYTIHCKTIDCTNSKDPDVIAQIKKYDIEGYPTVKMVKGDKVIDFDAKVTVSALTQFVNDMV